MRQWWLGSSLQPDLLDQLKYVALFSRDSSDSGKIPSSSELVLRARSAAQDGASRTLYDLFVQVQNTTEFLRLAVERQPRTWSRRGHRCSGPEFGAGRSGWWRWQGAPHVLSTGSGVKLGKDYGKEWRTCKAQITVCSPCHAALTYGALTALTIIQYSRTMAFQVPCEIIPKFEMKGHKPYAHCWWSEMIDFCPVPKYVVFWGIFLMLFADSAGWLMRWEELSSECLLGKIDLTFWEIQLGEVVVLAFGGRTSTATWLTTWHKNYDSFCFRCRLLLYKTEIVFHYKQCRVHFMSLSLVDTVISEIHI